MMTSSKRWLLPEGVSEVLPPEAAYLESISRRLLDLYATWGYELVMPPFIEYLDSLLVGTGADLDIQTFKLTDRLTGRLMGIRADMTPQVARIDAHQLKREAPTRLCYLGTVLHTLPDGFARSRAPLQIGAELYGHAGIDSDVEILGLLLETLEVAQIREFYLDVGHVAVYRGLARQAGLAAEQEHDLFDALQRKAVPEIHDLLSAWRVPERVHSMLAQLVRLNGGPEVLAEARQALAAAPPSVLAALDDLEHIAARMSAYRVHFDLAELRGYSYHTGAVFAAYVGGRGEAIAKGGRYDHIGESFGRARPATGFSTDLKTLLAVAPLPPQPRTAIFAPALDDPQLAEIVRRLRGEGKTVVRGLGGQSGEAAALGCTQELHRTSRGWQLRVLD